MEKRIYIATQANKSVLIRLDLTEKTAKRFQYDHDGNETRVSALEAMISELTNIDFETITVPVQLFVNDHMFKNITQGYYKYWIVTGKTNDGEKVEPAELALWEAFQELYSTNNLMIIIKSTSDAKISDTLKAMEGKYSKRNGKKIVITGVQKQNDKYSTYCWDELKKLVGSGSDVIDEDFEIAK
jgi:hypothetical protein